MAAEVEEVSLLPLKEHAAAFGADHGGRTAERGRVPDGGGAGHGRLGCVGTAAGKVTRRIGRERLPVGLVFPGHPVQDGRELPCRRDVVHRDAPERAHDHAGIGGFLGLLHQREPAAGLDLDQADGAVVEGSGEDDADDPGSEPRRRAPEEGIDGRAVPLLPGTVGAADAAAGQHQVLVGRATQIRPGRMTSPSTACVTSSAEARRRMLGSALTLWGGKWWTTNTAPGSRRAGPPPAEGGARCPQRKTPPLRCRELACLPCLSRRNIAAVTGGRKAVDHMDWRDAKPLGIFSLCHRRRPGRTACRPRP